MLLEDDYYCFACGSLNDKGLKLQFQLDKQKRSISTEFMPRKMHQGFKDIVHGGIIGLILDECMVNLAWKLGIHAMTGEYRVRFLRPAAVDKRLMFSAEIKSDMKRMLIIEGRCVNEKKEIVALSSSKCIRVNP